MTAGNVNKNNGALSLRVLIVEDSADDAVLVERELRRGGYDVTAERVETAEAMCAALDLVPWDIILSDYALPNFSAPAALEVFQASSLDLPFIIISGSMTECNTCSNSIGSSSSRYRGTTPTGVNNICSHIYSIIYSSCSII